MNFEIEMEAIFSGHDFQDNKLLALFLRWSTTSFIAGMKIETEYGLNLLCTEIEESYGFIYCIPYCTDSTRFLRVKLGTNFEEGTCMHFEVANNIFQARFLRCMTTFNVFRNIRIFC